MKPFHLDVKYNLQRGRVHCTLCENAEVDISDGNDVTLKSSKKYKWQVFRDVKVGDVLSARAVSIKERQLTGYGNIFHVQLVEIEDLKKQARSFETLHLEVQDWPRP